MGTSQGDDYPGVGAAVAASGWPSEAEEGSPCWKRLRSAQATTPAMTMVTASTTMVTAKDELKAKAASGRTDESLGLPPVADHCSSSVPADGPNLLLTALRVRPSISTVEPASPRAYQNCPTVVRDDDTARIDETGEDEPTRGERRGRRRDQSLDVRPRSNTDDAAAGDRHSLGGRSSRIVGDDVSDDEEIGRRPLRLVLRMMGRCDRAGGSRHRRSEMLREQCRITAGVTGLHRRGPFPRLLAIPNNRAHALRGVPAGFSDRTCGNRASSTGAGW